MVGWSVYVFGTLLKLIPMVSALYNTILWYLVVSFHEGRSIYASKGLINPFASGIMVTHVQYEENGDPQHVHSL